MPIKNAILNDYYFQNQIRKYMVQFMAIFSGMQVSIGENDNDSETELMRIPIIHGTTDRVVSALLSSNSPNIPTRLPIMTANLMSIQLAQDRMKGQRTSLTNTEFPRGGVFPDDVKSVTKLMPVPYYFGVELNLLASNLKHKYEMLEQIFLLFSPDLWFFTSDDESDWTAINAVQLNDITLEQNYPPGSEPRILSTTINFQFVAYMSAPAKIQDNVIQKIKLRIQDFANLEDFSNFEEEVAARPTEGEYTNIYDISELDPPTR